MKLVVFNFLTLVGLLNELLSQFKPPRGLDLRSVKVDDAKQKLKSTIKLKCFFFAKIDKFNSYLVLSAKYYYYSLIYTPVVLLYESLL